METLQQQIDSLQKENYNLKLELKVCKDIFKVENNRRIELYNELRFQYDMKLGNIKEAIKHLQTEYFHP